MLYCAVLSVLYYSSLGWHGSCVDAKNIEVKILKKT